MRPSLWSSTSPSKGGQIGPTDGRMDIRTYERMNRHMNWTRRHQRQWQWQRYPGDDRLSHEIEDIIFLFKWNAWIMDMNENTNKESIAKNLQNTTMKGFSFDIRRLRFHVIPYVMPMSKKKDLLIKMRWTMRKSQRCSRILSAQLFCFWSQRIRSPIDGHRALFLD